jgi:asparagine synthase (glutamine-hydrolysing)
MLDQLTHRGPDAGGVHTLAGRGTFGHRRLSIVDIEGGDQPLIDGDTVLVANGEIYNAPELRQDLAGVRRFATGSDNEVILHLLSHHGTDAVDQLRGMFAFALAVDGDLVLGRDPIGIKPLYTGRLDDEIVFASELTALPAGTVGATPLSPGTIWSERTGGSRYYRIPDPAPIPGDLHDHAVRVRAALEAAVERRLMSDVPIGAFLSGGLDSSAIVALLRPHVDELHTFSVGLPGSPDLMAAQAVADHVGTIHHSYQLDPDEIVAALPEIVWALESFDQDLVRSAVPTWFTARLAARYVKVVMTGEGADELFAGYRYHQDLTTSEIHREARRSLTELHHVNLQRVDRITMAHSLEARVPFLDLEMIETALAIPPALRQPGTGNLPGPPEKTVLRLAVADLLPPEVVWRDKAQFDEGSGTAGLLPELSRAAVEIDADAYRASNGGARLRSPEECWYHQLLVSSLADPGPVLANVARWTDR